MDVALLGSFQRGGCVVGLILSYFLNAAPGGFTVSAAVAVLGLVLIGKRIFQACRSKNQGAR